MDKPAMLEVRIFRRSLACRVPPPLSQDDGGFYYLKRQSDGAILLDGDDYVRFGSEDDASASAAQSGFAVDVRWMPKLRMN